MSFVNDNSKMMSWKLANFFDNMWEFLDGGNNDLFTFFQCLFQLLTAFGDGLDHAGHLLKLLDIASYLCIQYPTVGNHDDRIENDIFTRFIVQFHQLMRQPRNRIGFARTCRMLY